MNTSSTAAQSLFILSGIYNEQVIIPARKAALTIYGYTKDTSSHTSNIVTIQHSSSLASGAADDQATGTVQNNAANTKFYNINIKNTYGEGSQAIALAAYGDAQGYYGVGLYGYQDTLLTQIGNQVYAKCYIEGAIDFIFGQYARTWIDNSDIRVSGPGVITANGRPSISDTSYYVINKSKVAAAGNSTVGSGTVYLGRPWSQYARVCFQNTALSSIINGAGWTEWTSSTPNTAGATFQEYGNSGPGAFGMRANFSTKTNSSISISTILGSTYIGWVDTSYLAWGDRYWRLCWSGAKGWFKSDCIYLSMCIYTCSGKLSFCASMINHLCFTPEPPFPKQWCMNLRRDLLHAVASPCRSSPVSRNQEFAAIFSQRHGCQTTCRARTITLTPRCFFTISDLDYSPSNWKFSKKYGAPALLPPPPPRCCEPLCKQQELEQQQDFQQQPDQPFEPNS